jgi:nucleotide-binding universal stress UspA family protein
MASLIFGESQANEEAAGHEHLPNQDMLATDGSKEADLAAQAALDLAQKSNSEVHILHVLVLPLYTKDPASFEPEFRRQLEKRARMRLNDLLSKMEASGAAVEGSHLELGRADAEIVEKAEEIGAGLIVMGSRGFGPMRRALTGSVSDSVVRHAHCPVMVVRGEPLAFPTKVLLASDGSEEATLAASIAIEISESTDSELHLVYAEPAPYAYEFAAWEGLDPDLPASIIEAPEDGARSKLDEQVQRIGEAGGKIAEAHARVGHPDTEIVGLAGKLGAGLIVVGSRGLGPLKRALMGSVSDSVVHHSPVPSWWCAAR